MVKSLCFILRLTAYVNAETAKDLLVLVADDHREMSLTSSQLIKLILCGFRNRIGEGRDRESKEHLVSMETGISMLEILGFERADRLKDLA